MTNENGLSSGHFDFELVAFMIITVRGCSAVILPIVRLMAGLLRSHDMPVRRIDLVEGDDPGRDEVRQIEAVVPSRIASAAHFFFFFFFWIHWK